MPALLQYDKVNNYMQGINQWAMEPLLAKIRLKKKIM